MLSWEDNIRKVTPYIPGEQPKEEGIIKLNTNENPYPPAPGVSECLRKFDYKILRKYPNPDITPLREAIAKYHDVPVENVFVGVGSDDVLALAFLTFFNSKLPIIFPDITYSFYDVWANLFRIPYTQIPLKNDFRINIADYTIENGGVVIANPNAPTGVCESSENISRICYLNPASVVIVDEAYIDYSDKTSINLYSKYDNILTVRTFSKSRALAGSRIGYAVGSKKLIDHLMAVRNSFNSYTIDSVTMAVGIASIEDNEYFRENIRRTVDTREWFKGRVSKLGFTFPDSQSNFLFMKHESAKASDLFEELRNRNIYVRYFNKIRIDNYLRVTIGTREEMEILAGVLGEIL